MKWNLKSSTIPQSLDEVKQILLENRDIISEVDFFSPKHPNDFTLQELAINEQELVKAVKRIQQAIKNQDKVLIFGDYDADGICATAVLWETLNNLDLQAIPFIPHRQKHGYGISVKALEEIFVLNKPDLIVTVDNGIVAHDAIAKAIEEGVEVIITDHHQKETQLPPATAIVQTTKLCGAGVAWILAKYLDEEFSQQLLDLVGIATIADQVPLHGANRSFANHGIERLRRTKSIGLKSLFKIAGVDQDQVDSFTVAFMIAPRINAMGRLDHGLDALRLLCTTNKTRARNLASKLDLTNKERQAMTYDSLNLVMKDVSVWQDEHLIIVHSGEFHEGVIGLIAGKLTDKFNKPAIAISTSGEIAKASARSVEGVNIVELVRMVRDDLIDVGGHVMAAGFSLEIEKVTAVKDKLLSLAKNKINKDLLNKTIDIDFQLPFSLVSKDLINEINQFAPFGNANDLPIFAMKNLKIMDAFSMGKNDKHLKLVIAGSEINKNLQTLNCIAWNLGHLAEELRLNELVDIAGSLEFNNWNGRKTIQFKLKDIQLPSD